MLLKRSTFLFSFVTGYRIISALVSGSSAIIIVSLIIIGVVDGLESLSSLIFSLVPLLPNSDMILPHLEAARGAILTHYDYMMSAAYGVYGVIK